MIVEKVPKLYQRVLLMDETVKFYFVFDLFSFAELCKLIRKIDLG